MKKVSIPAYITGVPSEKIEFGEDSIIVVDDNIEWLVGRAAADRDPEGVRRFHGSFKRPQYRRLAMATIANLFGEGEFESDLAISVPKPSMKEFRKREKSLEIADEQWDLIKSSFSKIKFKKGSNDAPLQICKFIPTNGKVFYETQATKEAIPDRLKSFVLWQLGHGDFQQITFIDGKPRPDTHSNVEGISGPIKIFARLTGHAIADAEEGWRNGRISKPGGMDQEVYSDAEYNDFKLRACTEYFGSSVPKLLNLNTKYSQRANKVILAGGGAKDIASVKSLRKETEGDGEYEFYVCNELPIKDERLEDPSMTTTQGMLQHAKTAIDIGNSFLKGGSTIV